MKYLDIRVKSYKIRIINEKRCLMNLANNGLKKLFSVYILLLLSLVIVGCQPSVKETFTVTFNSDGGSLVVAQTIEKGKLALEPEDPTKEGFAFQHWFYTEAATPFSFETPIVENITLTASWVEVINNTALIEADIQNVEDNLVVSPVQLNLPTRGKVNRSTIVWSTTSKYVTTTGYLLPINFNDSTTTQGEITGKFTLNGESITRTFTVDLSRHDDVVITNSRIVPFENKTTEYDVAASNVELFYEADGSVPYIGVLTFLELLTGFVDPEVDFEITESDSIVEIAYQYIDEDTDEVYDLRLTIDAIENEIRVNDPGFYWGYIYSTATNYGRHIEYVRDHPDAHFDEGSDVVYDLDHFNLDMAIYGGEILLPYYIVNQLFAGSSYYNVYYNYDKLVGIYGTPEAGTQEYRAIKTSSKNNVDIPADLLVHTFSTLAFDLDNFYGLREIMGVDSYYDLLYERRHKLLDEDPEDFDNAIANLLLQDIDEPHTSYGYPSYFNKTAWSGPILNDLSAYGPRFKQWYYDGFKDVDAAIEAKWGKGNISSNAWAATSPNRPDYWFVNPSSAVLILDGFRTSDIEESSTFDAALLDGILEVSNVIPAVTGGSKYFFYNNSDETTNIAEVLVKGLNVGYVDTYKAALVSAGYTLVVEASEDTQKAGGYYTKNVDGKDYMVLVSFDVPRNVFYVGVANKLPSSYALDWPISLNIPALVKADSAVYMEITMDRILSDNPNVQRILLDLTWNTGGNVGALYRVVGFITDQPFRVSSIDGDTGGYSSSYVQIVGVPNYSHLKWSLLTSPLTFSAANSMATIFKENNLGKIIGKKSGGGASSITPILLPNGTAFTMSSNNINAYRTGTGTEADPYVYHHNEFGIEPDFVLEMDFIFDNDKLNQIIDQLP